MHSRERAGELVHIVTPSAFGGLKRHESQALLGSPALHQRFRASFARPRLGGQMHLGGDMHGCSKHCPFMVSTPLRRRACRIAVYRDGDVLDTEQHDSYIDWFFDTNARLRAALEPRA